MILHKKRSIKDMFFKILGLLCLVKVTFFVFALILSIFWSGFGAFLDIGIHPEFLSKVALTEDDKNLLFEQDESGKLYPTPLLKKIHHGQKSDDKRLLELHQKLKELKIIQTDFNWNFLTNGDSINPHKAGIGSAFIGTLYLLFIVLVITVPFGIAAGVFQEVFLSKKLKNWIDPLILNMASVPSIIYGLVGLVIFIQFFHLPRSSALVGGIVLSVLILPQMIVITQEALKSVPIALWESTIAMGATKTQALYAHVLPWVFRPILTSVVLSLARVMGETAPLLMIGMVAFIASPPLSPLEPSSALPVQIFLWSRNPDPAFIEKTSGAILVLILLLLLMNGFIAFIRQKMKRVS